jgi:hypothetical protein
MRDEMTVSGWTKADSNMKSISQIRRSSSLLRYALPFLLICLSLAPAFSTTYYVNAQGGRDTNAGLTANLAFFTINHACQVVQPGDTVIIYPGVYFENVSLWKLGTPAQPIVFQGYTRLRNTEIITGADPSFRSGAVPWTLVNSSLNLYSAPCSWLPARVLYDDVDLYPYASLNDLGTLTTDGTTPGPHHGFFYDSGSQLLYVRLNSKYGSLNPSQHTMMVGAPNGGGASGKLIQSATAANFVIHPIGSANVIIDGLTFETPGVAGIATKASDLTVQNCYFVGCRSAVYGLGDPTVSTSSTNNVVVQYCEYTLFPTFDDMADEIETAYQTPGLVLGSFWWWQRKDLAFTYELGFVLGVGSNWKIKNNYLHDVVDAISGWGCGNSQNLEISGNVIARTVDNSVEVGKGHESNMYVHDNVMLDSFEAINFEPMGGTPWPQSLYVSHNVIADTALNASPWKHMPWERGAFKFVVLALNWDYSWMANVSKTALAIPGAGLVANNNTVLLYNGNIFNFGGTDPLKLSNVHMINNFFVSYYAFALGSRNSLSFDFSGLDCQGNTVAPASDNISGPGTRVAGLNNQCLRSNSLAMLTDPFNYNFSPAGGSPLLQAGVAYSGGLNPSTDVGAYSVNGPTTLPVSGIQPDSNANPSTSIPKP